MKNFCEGISMKNFYEGNFYERNFYERNFYEGNFYGGNFYGEFLWTGLYGRGLFYERGFFYVEAKDLIYANAKKYALNE